MTVRQLGATIREPGYIESEFRVGFLCLCTKTHRLTSPPLPSPHTHTHSHRNSPLQLSMWMMFHRELSARTDTAMSCHVCPHRWSALIALSNLILLLPPLPPSSLLHSSLLPPPTPPSLAPRTRVPLMLQFGRPNSDYINANYIRVCLL